VVRVYWPAPTEQLFGEMRRVTVSGQRGAEVYVGTDMAALGPDLASRAGQDPLWRDAMVYLTCVHEIGRALGLPHTRDFRDIMYFFGYGDDIGESFARFRRQLKSRGDLRAVSALFRQPTFSICARCIRPVDGRPSDRGGLYELACAGDPTARGTAPLRKPPTMPIRRQRLPAPAPGG
jgi:hypothetical protein